MPTMEFQASYLAAARVLRNRDAEERRKEHASHVFIWVELLENWGVIQARSASGEQGSNEKRAHIKNAGRLPVYDVIVSWRNGDMMEHQERKATPLMPGDKPWEPTRPVPTDVDPDKFTCVALIRDVNEQVSRIKPDGRHDEIPQGQEPPHTW